MVAMPWSLGHPAIAYGIRMGEPKSSLTSGSPTSGKSPERDCLTSYQNYSNHNSRTHLCLYLFPNSAFLFATNMANLLAGTSNGGEPLMLSPIFCIIPVLFAYLFALVIGKFLKK